MNEILENHVFEVTTNFKRGTAEMLLLTLLLKEDQYAYELSKKLKAASHNAFDIHGPSLYTILYRLEEKGLVTTWTKELGKRPRYYYHITELGKQCLKRIREEYLSVTEGIHAVLQQDADR